jgi:hypothetical protein
LRRGEAHLRQVVVSSNPGVARIAW